MTSVGEKPSERPAVEPEIIPPGRPDAGRFRGTPGGIFFDFRSGDGASFQVKPVSRFKLALILILAAALALAIVLTFASLFVVAAVITSCAAAIAMLVAWVKTKLG